MFSRLLIAVLVIGSIATPVRGEQSVGEAVKKLFSTPTPTPSHKKKKTKTKTGKPTPSPTATQKASPAKAGSHRLRKSSSAGEDAEKSPEPGESASPKPKKNKSKTSPTPTETPAPQQSETAAPTVLPSGAREELPSSSPAMRKKNGAPNASLSPEDIKGFEDNPPRVRKLLQSALELTSRNLDYKYGSADPENGGMDCSGFVYYVLKQNGVSDVPRDSSQQYVWLRRVGTFEPVASRHDDSFELANLKPGDLLFWTGTYSIERDPPITHAMIYLGREKKTSTRVMVGASDGRVYQGQSRNGVSVFDFRVERRDDGDNGKLRPTFIGYGHVPGLHDD